MSYVSCKKCGLDYKSVKNLRQHVTKHHPLLIDKIAPKKKILNQGTNKCDECSKSFVRVCDLRRHQRSKHFNSTSVNIVKTLKNGIQCSICEFNCISHKMFMEHLYESHGINVEIENKTFNSIEELELWKTLEEKVTNLKYTKSCGLRRNLDGTKNIYYRCQRSGYYIPKGKGLRPLKSMGSRKLNGLCPAGIRVSISSNGHCKVCFVKTHVGHMTYTNSLSLSEQQLNLFSARIEANIPFFAILDEVRDSLSESKLERLCLVNKTEMTRIKNSFHVNSSTTNELTEGISLESWIQETIEFGTSCVLFYKPKGIALAEHPILNTGDFLMILMNNTQSEILKRYGNDCICMDRTIGLNCNGLELITLLVLDDDRHAFPCTFLFTNRTDFAILSVFLEIIRQSTDTLSPKIFISDRSEAFYQAWLHVMNPPAMQLYCMWHIDVAWRNNLSKIKTKLKQIIAYKMVRTLMNYENPETFEENLNVVVKMLCDDPETTEFGYYFLTEHAPYYAFWARCYRVSSGLETNMHMERVHCTLKHFFLNSKRMKRLDKTIYCLMAFVRDKLFKDLAISECKAIYDKIENINDNHRLSLQLSEKSAIEENNSWTVFSDPDMQKKNIVQELCSECQCTLQCQTCNVCIHRYICTCIDSVFKWNMCNHIHLACSKRNDNSSSQMFETVDGNSLLDCEALSVNSTELEIPSMVTPLEAEKSQLKDEICVIIDSISSEKELEISKNYLSSLKNALNTAKEVIENSTTVPNAILLPLQGQDPVQQKLIFHPFKDSQNTQTKNLSLQLVILKASNS